MKKIKAFTLAEVLITLTILGVVAAIAIPTLQKQNYKRTQISRMAKAYASLENAAANIAQNTNCIGKDIKCTKLLDITNEKEFQNKFAELANFRVSTKYSGGWISPQPLSYELAKKSDGGTNLYVAFVTTPDNIAYTARKRGNYIQVIVFTDKNKLYDSEDKVIKYSSSGKNNAIIGRDVFYFIIYDNFKVEPGYVDSAANFKPLPKNGRCSTARANCALDPSFTSWNKRGYSCAARIICDGWKMKY